MVCVSGSIKTGPVILDAVFVPCERSGFTLIKFVPSARRVSISLSASHTGRKRTLALRGAKGDRRAKRGSSRSNSRAALVE